MKEEFSLDPLWEFAVFIHLDAKSDLELILLKGHLLLETVLTVVLKRNGLDSVDNLSFYRKTIDFELINFKDSTKLALIAKALKEINRLRNQLAHEFSFDIHNGEFQKWAAQILTDLKGTKYTKYTHRTKIVHAFSILTANIIELD